MSGSEVRRPRHHRAVLLDLPALCPACDNLIEPGEVVALGEWVVHDECPSRWKPTVVEGGRGDDAPGQMALPMLTVRDGGAP